MECMEWYSVVEARTAGYTLQSEACMNLREVEERVPLESLKELSTTRGGRL